MSELAPGLALVFDMDGVLMDSNPLHRTAWEIYNRRFGIETTEEMHARMYGKRNDEIVRDFYGEQLELAEVMARGADKEALFRELAGGRVEELLVPGIREFLDHFWYSKKALATNAEAANVNFLLDATGFRQYFSTIISGEQVARPKPYPDIYLKVAEQLAVAPQNCIVLEDSLSGVAAAVGAGMRVVGVGTTHRELPGTELWIRDFTDKALTEWLCEQRA